MTTGTVLSETPTVWAELLLRRFLFRTKQCFHGNGSEAAAILRHTTATHLCYNKMGSHCESMSFF